MVDPVQRTSSVPIPDAQLATGRQGPLPLNAPKEMQRVNEAVQDGNRQAELDRFETYLNRTGISVLEKAGEDRRFDPAQAIASESTYTQQSGKTQF